MNCAPSSSARGSCMRVLPGLAAAILLTALTWPRPAVADEARPAPRPPYSVPFQLRPVAAASVIRADTVIAPYEDATGERGSTVASLWLGSYKLSPTLAPFVRLGVVRGSPPVGDGATALCNPALGVTYARPLAGLRTALSVGVTVPIGMGGGDDPDPATAAAVRSGVLARSAMDNAMFAVNDLAVFPGAAAAWVKDGVTVQVEATLFQLVRLRGADVQPDEAKTNFTTGLHVGYFVLRSLSVAGELRHQRWLSTPAFVEADARQRDTTSIALGARYHLAVGERGWFRPGLAYARGLDDPMSALQYHVVQVDLPLYF